MPEKKWSASNYRANKAKRLEQVEPEWVTNPETRESFLLRKVGAISSLIAGLMPGELTASAIESWKEQGLEVTTPSQVVHVTPEMIEQGQRELQLMAKVVQQACVIPKLTNTPKAEDEIDPADLDDSDVLFIFKWSTGQTGVKVAGGAAMNVADIKSRVKKPGLRARARNDGAKLQQSA